MPSSTSVEQMARSTHSPMAKKLREALRRARNEAGMTQAALAEMLDRPQSFVAKYEGGERQLDVVDLVEICDVLGLSPVDVVASILPAKSKRRR